jgi:hypothetical protein
LVFSAQVKIMHPFYEYSSPNPVANGVAADPHVAGKLSQVDHLETASWLSMCDGGLLHPAILAPKKSLKILIIRLSIFWE